MGHTGPKERTKEKQAVVLPLRQAKGLAGAMPTQQTVEICFFGRGQGLCLCVCLSLLFKYHLSLQKAVLYIYIATFCTHIRTYLCRRLQHFFYII